MKMRMNEKLQNKSLTEGFREFIVHCRVKNLSPRTIDSYEECFNSFGKFYSVSNCINKINKEVLDNYIFWLRETTGFNDISINSRLRSIRVILYYFMNLNYMQHFKIRLIKADKKVYETYTEQELSILIKKPNIKTCSFTEFRDWAICNTLIGTGIRVGTLIELKIEDIDFENDLISLKKMKGRKQQIIPMSSHLHKILIEYVQFRSGEMTDYLFCNQFGGRLTVNAIEHSMRKYHKKRGINKCGLHRYRHSFAKLYLENGGNVFKLQKLLSHTTLDIVKEYVEIFTSDLKTNYDNYNPLDRLIGNKEKIKLR